MPHSRSKLSPKLQLVFDQFIAHANKLDLHPYDWDRFYNYLCASHRLRSKLSGFEVKELLIGQGFPEHVASDISSVYDHGRAIIRKAKGSVLAYPGQPHDEVHREMRRADHLMSL